MKRTVGTQRGMSLVEATIILSANVFINTYPSTAWGSLSASDQALVPSWHSALDAFNNSPDNP